jgi:sortase (surface protein transpeptidase)
VTRRRVALAVAVLALVGFGTTTAIAVGQGGSAPAEEDEVTMPTAPDSDPTFLGPTPTFAEDEVRDEEGNVTLGEIPTITHRSARIEDLQIPVIIPPVGLRIPRLEVDAPVFGVGISDETFELDVPTDERLVSWYEFGPSPGGRGSSVLAGHVDYEGREGVFYGLRWLELGEEFEIVYEDGSTRPFEVVGRKQFDKEVLPTSQLFTEDGEPTVVLVTCDGEFDEGRRAYSDNLVVYAVPSPLS